MTIKYVSTDVVVMRGFTRAPVRLTATAWMNITRNAMTTFENAVGKPATQDAMRALDWLRACGVDGKETFDGLKARLALLALPGDPSRIIRCRKCNAVLSDPISKALGIGPDCRMGGKTRAPVRGGNIARAGV
jgi:hypothetical protein